MKKRLILHIGMHKTGSTYLQSYFQKHAAHNLEQHGLYYPPVPADRGKTRKHALLPASIEAHRITKKSGALPSPRTVIDRMTADILASGADLAIISAEGLSRPSPHYALECKPFADHFDVTVVIFLRRQDRFAESLHSQFIRDRGETRSMEQFLAATNIQSWMDYHSILKHWDSAFGTSAIHVIPFDASTLQRGLLQTFREQLSLPPLAAGKSAPQNGSPNREASEILRQINQHAPLKGMAPEQRQLRRSLLRAMDKLQIGGSSSAVLSSAARQALLERYEGGNAEIAARYLGRADGVLFHAERDDVADSADSWQPSAAETIAGLARTLVYFANARRSLDEQATRAKPPQTRVGPARGRGTGISPEAKRPGKNRNRGIRIPRGR